MCGDGPRHAALLCFTVGRKSSSPRAGSSVIVMSVVWLLRAPRVTLGAPREDAYAVVVNAMVAFCTGELLTSIRTSSTHLIISSNSHHNLPPLSMYVWICWQQQQRLRCDRGTGAA